MDPRILASIRSGYWAGESLRTLAQSHHLSLWHVEQLANIYGWHEPRAMLDELRAKVAELELGQRNETASETRCSTPSD